MRIFPSVAALLIAAALTMPVARADDMPAAGDAKMAAAAPAPAAGSDTLVIIVSDTAFGPDSADADAAARYYCANRGKVSYFVGKERPMEFRSQVLQQWALLNYRCVISGQAH
jgi:hypothetical protein